MQRECGRHEMVTPILSVKGKWRKWYFSIYLLYSIYLYITGIHCNQACSLALIAYKLHSLHRKVGRLHGIFPFNSCLKGPTKTLASISSTTAVYFAFSFHPSVDIPLAFVCTSDLVNVDVTIYMAAIVTSSVSHWANVHVHVMLVWLVKRDVNVIFDMMTASLKKSSQRNQQSTLAMNRWKE